MKEIDINIEESDGYVIENISTDLMSLKENTKIEEYISKLNMYSNNAKLLTETYTKILEEENVVFILTRISQNQIFYNHFPEFYIKNIYGENVINCQQNTRFHKYGVFKHTLYSVEAIGNSEFPISDNDRKILKWTMLLHDIGKPYVKSIEADGSESFSGHDDKSYEIAKVILDRFDFDDEDKNIILTLIKYHDKFVNEGEITNDNMNFLAEELKNSKKLFYQLLDVKDADAKSKTLEVIENYKKVKIKYIEFARNHFDPVAVTGVDGEDTIIRNDELSTSNLVGVNNQKANISEDFPKEEIAATYYDKVIDGVIRKKNIISIYQPIIDADKVCVHGYETYSKIQDDKYIDINKLLERAKETDAYEKVEQALFIHSVSEFESVNNKEAKTIFINMDLTSYEDYVNKPRMYDMMEKIDMVIELSNYEKYDYIALRQNIEEIKSKGAKILLDQFGTHNMTIDDLKVIPFDYIKPDITLIQNIEEDESKQKYISDLLMFCVSRQAGLILMGVENKSQFDILRKLGVRYFQGYYFARPDRGINIYNEEIELKINGKENERLV